MDNQFDKNEYLVPLSVATGALDSKEAFLLLAYYGFGIVTDKKAQHQYLTLETAIKFNEAELEGCDGHEKEYREALLNELRSINFFDQPFIYNDNLTTLWAKVFPNDAKIILKSQSKKIEPRLKSLLKESIK